MPTESLTIRLPKDEVDAMMALAADSGQTKTHIARMAIKEYCAKEQWYRRELQKGLDDVTAGNVTPIEDVEASWLKRADDNDT